VKTFNGTWGFLTSPGTSGDIFCHLRDSPQFKGPALQPGEAVTYDLVQGAKGRNNGLQAADVQRKTGGMQQRPHIAVRDTRTVRDAFQPVTGTLAKIRNGMAFCSVEGMADDVLLGSRSLMDSGLDIATLREGDSLTFELSKGPKGYSGTSIQRAPRSPSIRRTPIIRQTPTFQGRSSQRTTGTLKKIQGNMAFCHVEGVADDVLLGSRSLSSSGIDLATLAVGDTLSFELEKGPKGYSANGIERVRTPAGHWQVGEKVVGTLKKLSKSNGFCSVEGVEGDVLLGERSLMDSGVNLDAMQIGDTLMFDLATGPRGYHATNIQQDCLVTGTLKKISNGKGFCSVDGIAGDVLLGERCLAESGLDLSTLQVGDTFDFQLATGPKGYHATSIQRAVHARSRHAPSRHRGQQATGCVKKIGKDMAFCSVDGIAGDVLLGERSLIDSGLDLSMLQVGENLTFDLAKGPKGFFAENIQQDSLVTGTLKKISNGKGFCSVDGIAGDVLLGERCLGDSGLDLSTLQVGDTFDFQLATGPKGYHATSIQRVVHAPSSHAPSRHRGQQATGCVKKIGKDMAFCSVDGIAGDVLLGERSLIDSGFDLSMLQVGENLAFDLAKGPKGYFAENISFATSQPMEPSEEVSGTLRKIHKSMAFCSVEGLDGDVLLGSRSLRESGIDQSSLQVGDVFVFDLHKDSNGYHATNIRRE